MAGNRMNGQDFEDSFDAEMLQKLQMAELAILDSVTSAFREHGIKYFLGYGTLLGAVRHKGFIPWDEDVDIFVPRPDYERFIKDEEKIIKAPFIFKNYSLHDPQYDEHHVRIEDPSLQAVAQFGNKVAPKNVWIDVFPLDGAPKSQLAQRWLFFRLNLLNVLRKCSRSADRGYTRRSKSIFVEICRRLNEITGFGQRLSTPKIVEQMHSIRKKYDYERCEYAYALTYEYCRKRIVCRKEWFDTGKKAEFEGIELMIPSDSDAVLRQVYGDYLTLPPESERCYKHILGFVEEKKEEC